MMDARWLQDLRNLGIHGDEAADEIDRLTRELAEAKARAGSATASLPDGWVAVPVEATAKMATAAVNEADRQENKFLYDGKAFWSAMLSARPEFPKSSAYKFPSVDDLAQAIRRIDGKNSLGAGVLAEKIIEHFASKESGNE